MSEVKSENLITAFQEEKVAMTLWSDDKKKDYVDLFAGRTRAAKFIQFTAAQKVQEIALRRRFLSGKHTNQLAKEFSLAVPEQDPLVTLKNEYGYNHYQPRTYGGRTPEDLTAVAEKLAHELLGSMPTLNMAVKVISPETAKSLDKLEKLKEEGQKVVDALADLSVGINMADPEWETFTVPQFLQMVEAREDARVDLMKKGNKIGEQAQALEDAVSRLLYGGLPGLTDAVIKLIRHQLDRAKALTAQSRRVEEFVKFGDAEGMTDALKQFEKDEQTVSSEIKDEFAEAMTKLKKAAKDGVKLTAATTRQLRG